MNHVFYPHEIPRARIGLGSHWCLGLARRSSHPYAVTVDIRRYRRFYASESGAKDAASWALQSYLDIPSWTQHFRTSLEICKFAALIIILLNLRSLEAKMHKGSQQLQRVEPLLRL
jgi:hypothetical protein